MVTIFDVAKALARTDAAMIRADVPQPVRQRVLDELSDALVREGLSYEGPPPIPLRAVLGGSNGR